MPASVHTTRLSLIYFDEYVKERTSKMQDNTMRYILYDPTIIPEDELKDLKGCGYNHTIEVTRGDYAYLESIVNQVPEDKVIFMISCPFNLCKSAKLFHQFLSVILERGHKLFIMKFDRDNCIEIDNYFISLSNFIRSSFAANYCRQNIKKAIARGAMVGRKKGSVNKKLPLDKHLKKIKTYMRAGVSKADMAKLLNVKYCTINYYIKEKKLNQTFNDD